MAEYRIVEEWGVLPPDQVSLLHLLIHAVAATGAAAAAGGGGSRDLGLWAAAGAAGAAAVAAAAAAVAAAAGRRKSRLHYWRRHIPGATAAFAVAPAILLPLPFVGLQRQQRGPPQKERETAETPRGPS